MFRFYKFPKWFKGFYPGAIWDFFLESGSNQKVVYLTFDDGPTKEVSEWILAELKKVNAKATFFCVGENVKNNPKIFKAYLNNGHSAGNHTMNHLKGSSTNNKKYLENVLKAKEYIDSSLFRPPYGKCTPKQYQLIKKEGFKTVFWSHLTYDFDATLSSEKRIEALKSNLKSGSVLVFHDSFKAFPQLKTDLPVILNYMKDEGYQFKRIEI